MAPHDVASSIHLALRSGETEDAEDVEEDHGDTTDEDLP